MALLCLAAGGSAAFADHLWINEFHYDNTGTDVNEFVEVVMRTPNASGATAADYAVVLYNGSNGAAYTTSGTLDTFSTITSLTDGADTFTFYSESFAGMQNGSPDGIALVNVTTSSLVSFISYEGSFMATDGIALGTTSTEVVDSLGMPIFEDGTGPTTGSLSLTGTGRGADDFTAWELVDPATPAAENVNQTLVGNPAAPANDDFANREVISGAMGTLMASNLNSTNETNEAQCGLSPVISVWYGWTAPDNGDVTFSTCGSGIDTTLGAFTGTAVDALVQEACNDDFCGLQSSITFSATMGTEYKIRVGQFGGAATGGDFTLTWAPFVAPMGPDNDDFASRRPISSPSGSDTGTNVNATPEMGESAPSCAPTSPETVWWGWTAPSNGTATFDTFGSDFDTVMDVFTGSPVDNLDFVDCNDDFSPIRGGGPSLVTFNATMGTEYQIRVTGFDDAGGESARGIFSSGNITLNWTLLGGGASVDCGPGGVGTTDGTSELALWLRADQNVTESGGAVSAWGDLSGNGLTATQGNGPQQPTFVASQAEENGNPTIDFDGTDNHLVLSGDPLPDTQAGGGWTVFALSEKFSALSSDCLFGTGGPSNTFDAPTFQTFGANISHFHTDTGVTTNAGNIAASEATIMEWHRDGDNLEMVLNGLSVFSNTRAGEGRTAPGSSIGGVPTNASQTYDGTIGEFIIYDAPQNSAARRIVRNYMSARYDVIIGAAEDRYEGDDTENGTTFGDFDFEVAGIGQESDGQHPSACSGGMLISDAGFLADDGDYVMLGHDNTTNSFVMTDLPGGVTQRFARTWYVDITDVDVAARALGGNVTVTFDYAASGLGSTPDPDSYALLFRPANSGGFAVVANNGTPSGGQVVFNPVALGTLSNGYYTLGQGSAPLSVELESFEATAPTPFMPVKVSWTTSAEIDLVGFNIHRAVRDAGSRAQWSIGDSPLNAVAIPGRGNPSRGADYSFTDSIPANGRQERAYFLIDIDLSGRETIHGPAFVQIGRDPQAPVADQAGPAQEDARQPEGDFSGPSVSVTGRLR